jgi:hypothetical protein
MTPPWKHSCLPLSPLSLLSLSSLTHFLSLTHTHSHSLSLFTTQTHARAGANRNGKSSLVQRHTGPLHPAPYPGVRARRLPLEHDLARFRGIRSVHNCHCTRSEWACLVLALRFWPVFLTCPCPFSAPLCLCQKQARARQHSFNNATPRWCSGPK